MPNVAAWPVTGWGRPPARVWPDVVVSMAGLSVSEALSIQGARTKLVMAQPLLDQARAGEMQVEHLFSKGHHHLGYAYPSNANVRSIADERLAGTRAACDRLGIPAPAVESIDRNDAATINRALDSWNSRAHPITAICAHNDEIAVMLCLAITARGLRVGKDIAVIGIDGIPISRLGISTVAIDIAQTTQRIVEHVVAAMESRPAKISRKPVLSLIVRESG